MIDPPAPAGWRNWKAFDAGQPWSGSFETVLYSDARFIDEILDAGPYEVLNLVGSGGRLGVALPALVVRIADHLERDVRADVPERGRPGSYHGGWIPDELAALLSVALNVRLQRGGTWRWFRPDGDPRGQPTAHDARPPYLAQPEHWRAPILPTITLEANLGGTRELIEGFHQMQPADAREFIRAARLFQRAVWSVEGDPQSTFLLLFAALEAASNRWRRRSIDDPLERVRRNDPDLGDTLARIEDDQIRLDLAKQLAKLSGAQAKVTAFVEAFAPDPPAQRSQMRRVDWNALPEIVRVLYGHRSHALHAGIPIPHPLLLPPHRDSYEDEDSALEEAPLGLSVSVDDASWPAHDLPMCLWLFAHVVRGSLISWSRTMMAPH